MPRSGQTIHIYQRRILTSQYSTQMSLTHILPRQNLVNQRISGSEVYLNRIESMVWVYPMVGVGEESTTVRIWPLWSSGYLTDQDWVSRYTATPTPGVYTWHWGHRGKPRNPAQISVTLFFETVNSILTRLRK